MCNDDYYWEKCKHSVFNEKDLDGNDQLPYFHRA